MAELDLACHIACFILMMAVVILSIISMAEPWWLDIGVAHTTIMTLWSLRRTGSGDDTTNTWHTLCQTWSRDWGHDWCSKIKASRAFVLMTVIFAIASALCYFFLIRGFPDVRFASIYGLVLSFATCLSIITAFGLGLYYPHFSSFDTPQTGFVSICVALPLIFASMVSGVRGVFAVRVYTQFEDTKVRKSKEAEKMASLNSSVYFRLNSEAQLVWTPELSIGKPVDPSVADCSSNDDVSSSNVDKLSNDYVDRSGVGISSNGNAVKYEA